MGTPAPAYHLAQLNIARLTAPLSDPQLADFVAALEPVNAVADASPGFVWRLQDESGNATGFNPFDDQSLIVNMSLWDSLEALRAYVVGAAHGAVLRRRREWFQKISEAYAVLWWVPAGHRPDLAEARSRLERLRASGPTADAFTMSHPFPPPTTPLRSRHVDQFNHDGIAAGYDDDVQDESDPIRTGYADVLAWVATRANRHVGGRLLELGSGSGNLTARLRGHAQIVAVDISTEMGRIARGKVGDAPVEWAISDLLEYVATPGDPFDVVVSTYAIHHLTAAEKTVLIAAVGARLRPGGVWLVGDLMVESEAAADTLKEQFRTAGQGWVAEAMDEEFFWDLSRCLPLLERQGFEVTTRRFSTLSWGIEARRPGEAATDAPSLSAATQAAVGSDS